MGRNHKLRHVAGWVTLNLSLAVISNLYQTLSLNLCWISGKRAPLLHSFTAGRRTMLESCQGFRRKENEEGETPKNQTPNLKAARETAQA